MTNTTGDFITQLRQVHGWAWRYYADQLDSLPCEIRNAIDWQKVARDLIDSVDRERDRIDQSMGLLNEYVSSLRVDGTEGWAEKANDLFPEAVRITRFLAITRYFRGAGASTKPTV